MGFNLTREQRQQIGVLKRKIRTGGEEEWRIRVLFIV